MSSRYWNDQVNMDFCGDAKDKLPSKGQPNKYSGEKSKTNSSFQKAEPTDYTQGEK